MKSRLARGIALLAALTLVLALAACGGGANPYGTGGGTKTAPSGGSAAPPAGNVITEQNIAFSPTSLAVKVGDTVTFKNDDSTAHQIVVGTEDLGIQQPGESKTWKATKAGTIDFKCIIHPSMTGQFTVQ